jgi:hypothetical protein
MLMIFGRRDSRGKLEGQPMKTSGGNPLIELAVRIFSAFEHFFSDGGDQVHLMTIDTVGLPTTADHAGHLF